MGNNLTSVMGNNLTIDILGFRTLESAVTIKTYLERYTGAGSIQALQVRQSDNHAIVYARVQFTTRNALQKIEDLCNKRELWYDSHALKVHERGVDLVPKHPRNFVFSREDVTLHFGCLVSEDKFSALLNMKHATVELGLQQLHIFVWRQDATYKLQLLRQNISQVQLHCPPHPHAKFLVIQLLHGAPLIYEKTDDNYSFYKELHDDHWVRTTDFTPSHSIGKSSHICIELPHGVKLEGVDESYGQFMLEHGNSFSLNGDLVPIVDCNLPFDILFKICSLVQRGRIPGPALNHRFYKLLDPRIPHNSQVFIENMMEKISFRKDCCYSPVEFITEEYNKPRWNSSPAILLNDGLVYVRRVEITPTKVYFCGPEVNKSNMVLRHFREHLDNFLRVSFVDEGSKLYSIVLSPTEGSKTRVYDRILSILNNGIQIGDKKFEFLAFSTSQLHYHSVWMFASTGELNATIVRNWMGDFSSIKKVAKYAARLGQSFSASKTSLIVRGNEVEEIPDIETKEPGTKYMFSDGIGKISVDFAEHVSAICGYNNFTPSAFQIRYGGYKGVVAVDQTSSKKLSLRNSMCKFKSHNNVLSILEISRYRPCYLNRELITLLSTLGIPDGIFENMQKQEIKVLKKILRNPIDAKNELEYLMPAGDNKNVIMEMISCGYEPGGEPFLSMMMYMFIETKILELRSKARIYVHKGRSMIGCLDETRTLKYGEVFVQYSSPKSRHEINHLTRNVVVAKNPCLHPGDVRVLKAVNVPKLAHMVDCIVFPQNGKRPHPNECSGSDLDGDIYFVCWDHDLIPTRQEEPMDYSTPTRSRQHDHNITIQEVQKHFAEFIIHDNVGIIAHAHTVFADSEPEKAKSRKCVELAKLFSIAVDFPKTGVHAEIPASFHPQKYPDFLEKPEKPTYKSNTVLGKLFREVKDFVLPKNPVIPFTKAVASMAYDSHMEQEGFKRHTRYAFKLKQLYDFKLGNLMDYYGIKTESEVLTGSIIGKSESFDDEMNHANQISAAAMSLRNEARNWFKDWTCRDAKYDDVYAKASACYHVTYHPHYWGGHNQMGHPHFLSFPWCFHHELIQIKRKNSSIPRHG